SGNVIGGSLAASEPSRFGNTMGNIWNGPGVLVHGDDSTANTIRGNSMFDAARVGIRLETAFDEDYMSDDRRWDRTPTPNDAGDIDEGPNDLMNYPRGLELRTEHGGLHISGFLDTIDPSDCTIDVYAF